MESLPAELETLRAQFEEHGQGHVFKYFSEYNEQEQQEFIEQLKDIDLDEIERLYNDVCVHQKEAEDSGADVSPVEPELIYNLSSMDKDTLRKLKLKGARQINKGTVGLMIMAGGMGTRLGSNDPKGMYDIGLPSHKSIFQIICEKFRRVQKYSTELCQMAGENCAPRFKCMLYIMTSRVNDKSTKKFFKDNDYFGIKEDRIMFFMQSALPTLTFDGKIMFESRKSLSVCPNGNGALFKSLLTNEDLKNNLKYNNIEYLHLVGVDNVLTKFLDPVQVGLTYENELKGTSRFISKAYPTEPIGVFVKRGSSLDIIEYTQLGESLATETYENGELKFNQGNFINFFLNVEMLLDLVTGKAETLNSLYN